MLAVVLLAFSAVAVGLVADSEVTADDVEVTTDYTLTYKVGASSYTEMFGTTTTTLKTLEVLGATVPDGKKFDGWSLGAVTVAAGSTVTLNAEVETVVEAVFSDITYTVKFMDGETVVATFTGIKGTPIEEIPALDDKATHLFGGWEPEAIETIEGDAIYNAVWNEVYDVTWIVEGAVIAEGTMLNLNVPANPVKDHFIFGGWSDGTLTYTAAQINTAYVFEADTTFTALFTPVTLTITYMAGDEVVATDTCLYGAKILMPDMIPVGYIGWDYDFDTPVTEDLTINAVLPAPADRSGGGYELAWTIAVIFIGLFAVCAFILIKNENDKRKAKEIVGDAPGKVTEVNDTILK